MKRKILFLFALLWQSIALVCDAQPVDPVHQKYWLMRARFRDQFIVRGVDPLPVCDQKTSVYGLPIGSKKPYNDEVRYHKSYKDGNGSFVPAITIQPGREDSCGGYKLLTNGTEEVIEQGALGNNCKTNALSYNLNYGDSPMYLGWYMGVLATEYHLLQNQNQGVTPQPAHEMATLYELYCAFKALERLEVKVHTAAYGNQSCGPKEGYLLRDDVGLYEPIPEDERPHFPNKHTNTWGRQDNYTHRLVKAVRDNLNTFDVKTIDDARFNFKYQRSTSDFQVAFLKEPGEEPHRPFEATAYHNLYLDRIRTKNIFSLDHTVHLLMGLGLVKKFAPGQMITVYDDQGKVVGTINFTTEVNNYLRMLKNSLERDWYMPKLTGSNFFPIVFDTWESGVINAGLISIAIDRIYNNDYGNLYHCDRSSDRAWSCSEGMYSLGIQFWATYLDQYIQNVAHDIIKLIGIAIACTGGLAPAMGAAIGVVAKESITHLVNIGMQQYSHAILGSLLAQSAPYYAGIRLQTEWRGWLLTNLCNLVGSCDNLKLRYLCLKPSSCILLDQSGGCSMSFSVPLLADINVAIGNLVGYAIGVNPGQEVCILFPNFWGAIPDVNQDWSVNVTSGLIRSHFKRMVAQKELEVGASGATPSYLRSMERFYSILEYVNFNKSIQHRTDLPDFEQDFYNCLNSMPCSGPQHLAKYDQLPRNEKLNPNHQRGWRADNMFIKFEDALDGHVDLQGKFNGLDYMLFHNLYRIAFPDRPNPPYANKMISNATLDQLKAGDNAFFEEYQPTASGAGVGTATRRVYAGKSIQLMGAENVTGGQTGYSYMIKPVDAPGTNNPSALLFKPLVPTCDNSALYKLDAPYNNARQAAPVDTTPKPDYTQEQIDSIGRKMLSDIRSRVKRIRPIPKYQPVSAFVASAPSVPMATQEQLSLYPNPATTMLNLQLSGLGEVALTHVAVTSTTGSTTVLPFTQGNNGAYICPVSDLTPGLYIINVVTKRGNYVRKFTKQ